MYTLYARPAAGSAAIEALLAEIGVDHKITDILREADGATPVSYFKINPRGEIPTLRLPDNSLMTESAAMLIYLADRHSAAGLAPAPDAATRPAYLRWILYFATTIYAADLRMYYSERFSTDGNAGPGINAKAIADMERDFQVFADGLGEGPFILGSTFSAADLYVAMLVSWANDVEALFAKHPNIKRHYDAVAARPKVRPIWERNKMLFA